MKRDCPIGIAKPGSISPSPSSRLGQHIRTCGFLCLLSVGLLVCPLEFCSITPHTMHDDSQLSGHSNLGLLEANAFCKSDTPDLEHAPFGYPRHNIGRRFTSTDYPERTHWARRPKLGITPCVKTFHFQQNCFARHSLERFLRFCSIRELENALTWKSARHQIIGMFPTICCRDAIYPGVDIWIAA